MKTLPDNPNLNHLRQQAKDLLTGLRDIRPAATLSDAQASLAEQYGFRGWVELKAEVDRMRGRAEVADADLAQAIASRFDLGEVTGPMRSVARADHLGRPWSLETAEGRWSVYTVDNDWYPIVDTETEVALQDAAAQAGVLLPAPVRSQSGAIVEAVGEHRWRVNEWLHSGPPLVAPVGAWSAFAAGAILATVHGLGLPVDRLSPWHASRLSQVDWSELAATANAQGAGWAPLLAEAVPTLVGLETVGEGVPVDPPVLCHNALGPNYARLGPGGRLIVVGWEHAGGQPPAWEVADALMHWTIEPGGDVNTAGARAMLDGYRSVAGKVPRLEMASFGGAAISILNYVAGQIELALQAGDAEERHFTDRNVRHLLSHLASRTKLERLLEAIA